ncbi:MULTISPECIES: pyrroloquinoline quinone biosynthesis protein PqqB [Mesorhizobium]|uniref:Coenzyme PQQ synthesis protein B n=1 Tax=Mesorhizobium denitrificans TaxID=2294114 RepID=A0A371XEK6_9HYPH|nr:MULTISPECIES: pyrroloquinoline quinone biosynthesis protein PqqB [Mesorhizobium]RFC67665.1 pyrroloquinoline quinone biosynthesis protein PqqB [Mesorhizobium denitrificans]
MRVRVLGSAAGGGVPQWNCNFTYSRRARLGDGDVPVRLQSSIATSNSNGWVIFNASPDIRQQVAATPSLQPDPNGALRTSPIKAIVLTNADIDHIAGLLSLRERQPFNLYATERVLGVLMNNAVFQVLDPAYVRRIPLQLDQPTTITTTDGEPLLEVQLYSVPGKVALYLETGEAAKDFGADDGDTIGVRIAEIGGRSCLHYVPGCASVTPTLKRQIEGADFLFFDGTVFRDDEMRTAGVGEKTGQRMGHLAIDGPEGSMAALAYVSLGRRCYIHINNTNPILDQRSPERAQVENAGWMVAFDGMEFDL